MVLLSEECDMELTFWIVWFWAMIALHFILKLREI